jgi:cation transport regulator ChaC
MQRNPRLRRNKDIIGVVFARKTASRPNVQNSRGHYGTCSNGLLDLIQDTVCTQVRYEVTGSKEEDNERKRQREMKSLTNTSVSQPTAALPTQYTPA